MQQSKAKTWVIVTAAFLTLLALPFFPLALIYSLPLLLAGLYYDRSRLGFWSSLVLALPFVIGVSTLFTLRLYLLFFHGGEAPGGDGSPLAFLVGFALEMPFYVLLVCLLVVWVRDFRRYRSMRVSVEEAEGERI